MINRGKKTALNVSVALIDEVVALICGLILPRLMLRYFGSQYNGITTSITQFLQCIALLKSGIGGVTRFALYKPLAENDTEKISDIVSQTERFMKRIAIIFLFCTFVFASLYSFIISNEFEWWFSASLVIIISVSTFVQYYFGFTYQMVLIADQKQWIYLLGSIFTYIGNTLVSALLIMNGNTIHEVKLGSALVLIISPILINIYTKKKYNIIKRKAQKTDYISQRWDAVGHEVANFINNNTDVMVLTVFTNLFEVSVYSVYRLVMSGIQRLTSTFIATFAAAFGNMYALKQQEVFKGNFRIYETFIFISSTVVYSVTMVMILPFVTLYTNGVNDVEYIRPAFAFFISLAGLITCFRIPYQTIITSIGHYKQTRNGAFIEAAINIVSSIILVIKFGLIGVAVGTLLASIFRTVQYASYVNNNVMENTNKDFYIKAIIGLFDISLFVAIFKISNVVCDSVSQWIIIAALSLILSTIITIVSFSIAYKNDVIKICNKALGIIIRRR